jgi:hypothetical protein
MRRSVFTPLVASLLVLGCGGNSGAAKVDATTPDISASDVTKLDANSPDQGHGDAGLPDLASADMRFGSDTMAVNDADGPVADLSRTPGTSDGKPGDSDGGPFSPNSTQTLSQLTTSQIQALCDQIATNQGGYGRVVYCDGSVQTTDTSQASCAAYVPFTALSCPTLTVGNLVSCSLASGPDLCSYPIVPGCTAVFNCLG